MATLSQAMLAPVAVDLDRDECYPNHQQRKDENNYSRSIQCGTAHHGTDYDQDQSEAPADPHSTIVRPIPLSILASPRRRASLAIPR